MKKMDFNEFIEKSDPNYGVAPANTDDISKLAGEINKLPNNIQSASETKPLNVKVDNINVDKMSEAILQLSKVVKGEKGEKGVDGKPGKDGLNGKDGKDGRDGKDGKDGRTPIKGKDYFDGIDGKDGERGPEGKRGLSGKDGKNGKDGVDGKDGKDGKQGPKGERGPRGKDGASGVYTVTGGGTSDHTKLTNLAYADAGHTGFEPSLPDTPDDPENKFLDGNKEWHTMAIGSGGFSNNLYLSNTASTDEVAYKQLSYLIDASEVIGSVVVNNNTVLSNTFLYEDQLDTTVIPSGVWRAVFYSKVSSAQFSTTISLQMFLYHADTTETNLFTMTSTDINSTDYERTVIESSQPAYACLATDRFGMRLSVTTTRPTNTTVNYKIGDGYAAYFNTTIATRHAQLRDLNGDPEVQHMTSAEQTKLTYINQDVKTTGSPTFAGLTTTGSATVTGTAAANIAGFKLSNGTLAVYIDQYGSLFTSYFKPKTNITYSIGTSSLYYTGLYARTNYFNSTALIDGATAGQLTITGNPAPTTDSTYTNGTSSLYWKETYTDRLYLNSTAYLDGGTAGTVTCNGQFKLEDTYNIAVGTTTGTKIGTAENQKLGFFNATPIVQPTELTDELTSITHTAPSVSDYAIQDLTDSGGFGFKTKDEGNTVLSVILNLQTRVNELETKLVSLGLLADAD